MKLKLLPSLLALCIAPSCAYMQSYKNIEVSHSKVQGQELTQPNKLYLQDGVWYVKTLSYDVSLRYPLFNDSIFLESGAPSYVKLGSSVGSAFYPISQGTASVLLQPQGYASLSTLAHELKLSGHSPVPSLSHASSHAVKAQFESSLTTPIITPPASQIKPSPSFKSWSNLIFIDSIGTLVYNVAIPFMAPYYFFKNTIRDHDKDPFP